MAELEDEAALLASLSVGEMWDRLRKEFMNEWAAVNRRGIGKDELEAHMEAFLLGLSEKPLEDLARKSSAVAYNSGRASEISERPEVSHVVRSEALDAATCDACARLDSVVIAVASPEFTSLMPPALCEGRGRCRGFYIAITDGLTGG